ncbi:hypothetical protein EDD16DRAFT_1527869 [Pisolithus croceorrhizus]|nr:hypothetical protein EDD16DRAFT_1527869 [Pisolithus croceorrhizus]
MPRGNEEGAPRFSGHPDDLIWFLEDVRELCMQASCFEDCEWAQWCPAVCYSKRDLYNLVDKQKKVKIDSYQALLNYRLSFTDIAVQLRISSQLSWIEKDDLFLEGQYVDDPWPTYQVAREAERLLKEGYRFKLREARLARDQWSAQEAQYEAEMRESRAAMTKEQCRGLERCSESARLGSKASQPPSSTSLEIQSLTHSLQDSSKPSKAPGVGSRSQAVKVDSIESSFKCIEVTSCIAKGSLTAGLQGECLRGRLEEKGKGKVLGAKTSVEPETTEAWGDSQVSQPKYFHSSLPPLTDIQPQIPPIELRDTEDEQRANKRPVEAEAHVLEVPKPTLEPRGDLCEVPGQAGSVEVEEIELGVEAEGQSKGWTRSLGVETCTTSPSVLSQPAKRSGTTVLRVNDAHSLAPRTCSAAAVEIYTSLSQKSENYLFKGYEVYGRKVEAPHSAGWSAIPESTAISSTRKSTNEAALRVRTPQILYTKMQKPPCVEGEARQLQEGPHSCDGPRGWGSSQSKAQAPTDTRDKTQASPFVFLCFLRVHEGLLWRVFSVFLEDTLWSSKPLSRPLLRSSNPALSHWTLILVRGLMLSCLCEPTASIYEYLGHQERAKRWQGEAPP